MQVSPDYRLLNGLKDERSMSGLIGPGGKATLEVNEPRLYHGFVLALTGGMLASHIETLSVRYNQNPGFDAPGEFFRARQIFMRGTDSDVVNHLYVDFADTFMNGAGNDFRTSLNLRQRGPDGREIETATLELTFAANAPAAGGVRVMSNVGPAIPIVPQADGSQEPAGPGVVKRIVRIEETGIGAGEVTVDRIVPPNPGTEFATIKRIWAKVNPLNIEWFEIRNGTQIESRVSVAEYITRLSQPLNNRVLPADYFPLFDGGYRAADVIDVNSFSKFELRLKMQDAGGNPPADRLPIFTEFEGAL